ncbi:hypothetical protein J2848_000998 [Azospirillum lipoferum]|uniref:Uncharacterized protein n=1 Tax=Azospirillum lipoferum TaxID=193 RepID=A0A5A9GW63_AZOLI|nr:MULTISPECIES: hypothetical protein [Azospirillum]KAA0598630.1 hypothetical protein FZ942_06060 [Azospirillum lipoferum]MCP1609351.1 hypothetical protein [Azospirillum lipoferum]MDW5535340.1 hypothetical protein [Azospirillum sp. NL1]
MGTQRKPLEDRSEKKVGAVRIRRDSVTGRFAVSARPDTEPAYKAETVERVKALADAPASGEAMDGETYLRWLNG